MKPGKRSGRDRKPVSAPLRQARLTELLLRAGEIASADEIPTGAVLADRSKLKSRSGTAAAPKWYVDLVFFCHDCGQRGVWTAGQQYWWHEVAGGDVNSTAIRCRACRMAKREKDREMTRQMERSREVRNRKRAAQLAAALTAKGPAAAAVLRQPVGSLDLPEWTLRVLRRHGILSVGDVAAMDKGRPPADLRISMQALERRLLRLGLKMTGAPVTPDSEI